PPSPEEGIARRDTLTSAGPPSAGITREAAPTPPPSPAEDDGHATPPLRRMLGSVTVWALCAASCGVNIGWYFYITWQPEYLEDVLAVEPTDSKFLPGLPFLFGAAGALLGGVLSDRLVRRAGRRWGRSLVGLVGFAGAGLCAFATGFVPHAWQA